jgi:hypothetical protein
VRDLLAIVEGKDDAAVLRAVLIRPRDLGIRSITFHTEQRASGMIARGPELAREQRREFRYVLCLWDHQGSGQEAKPPSRVQGEVQARLNRNTLKGCSKALVIDPELEVWLWQDLAAIAQVLGVEDSALQGWLAEWRDEQFPTLTVEEVLLRQPKEAFEQVIRRAGLKPAAALRERVAAAADLHQWAQESSFRLLRRTLRRWFAR